MNMKKLALIGVLALVVIGCVLAAGCTSTTTETTTTSTDDAVAGIWTLPDGTTVVFGNDFNGVMTTGDNETKFTWKKTTDGKYQVESEDGTQDLWTLDNVKGIMTNAAGTVLTKQASDTSGTLVNNKKNIKFGAKPVAYTHASKGEKLIDDERNPYILESPSDGVLEFGYSITKKDFNTASEYNSDYVNCDGINRTEEYKLNIQGITYPTNWTTGNVILGDDVESGDFVYIWCRIKDNNDYNPYCIGRINYMD